MAIYLGIDCGGSTTRALAVDSGGRAVFRGQAGSANLVTTPESVLLDHLAKATAGCPRPSVVCACFAGLSSDRLAVRAKRALRSLFPHARLRLENDAIAALVAAGPEADMCVISGTGSIVCSLSEAGLKRTGGLGYLLGDSGSAYRYGRRALMGFLEGAGSQALAAQVERKFGSRERGAILEKLYTSESPAALLASLAPGFAADLSAQEAYASEFLRTESRRLAELAASHIARYSLDRHPLHVALMGGLWRVSQAFARAFEEELRSLLSDREIRVLRPKAPPVRGAVQLAIELNHEH